MTSRSSAALPPELGGPAEAYLRAFLDGREAERAVAELARDVAYWEDDGLIAVLVAARAIVTSRVRATLEAEAVTLVDELDVPVPDAAIVLDVDPDELERRLDAAREVERGDEPPDAEHLGVRPTTPAPPIAPHPEPVRIGADGSAPDATPDDVPTHGGPRVGTWLAVALMVLAVLVAMLVNGR